MPERSEPSQSSEITPSARRMMLALEPNGLDPASWRSLAIRMRPTNPMVLPDVAVQLQERGWVEVADNWVRLTSAGLNALAMKAVML